MKKDKLKKYALRFGIAFLIALALLTYFSTTIDNILLPQVKVTEVKEVVRKEDAATMYEAAV